MHKLSHTKPPSCKKVQSSRVECMVKLTTNGDIRMWPRFKLPWPMHQLVNNELQIYICILLVT